MARIAIFASMGYLWIEPASFFGGIAIDGHGSTHRLRRATWIIERANRGATEWIGRFQATPRFGFNSQKDYLGVHGSMQDSERRGQRDPGGLQVPLGPGHHQANHGVEISSTGAQHWRF